MSGQFPEALQDEVGWLTIIGGGAVVATIVILVFAIAFGAIPPDNPIVQDIRTLFVALAGGVIGIFFVTQKMRSRARSQQKTKPADQPPPAQPDSQ